MELYCPNCKTKLKHDNINVGNDLAKCHKCETLAKVSEIIDVVPAYKATPPIGSTIEVKKGFTDDIEIILPKGKLGCLSIPILIFAIAWLSFIAFWTFMALKASILFALFSIPFWLVGIMMLYGVFKPLLFSGQTILLNKYKLSVSKKSIFGTKVIDIDINDIRAITMNHKKKSPFHAFNSIGKKLNSNSMSNIPYISSPITSFFFFETASQFEQEWIVAYLNEEVKLENR